MTLRELRESHFMTQTEVAAACAVTVTTVSNWERGEQQPRIVLIRKLAEVFQTTPQEIQQSVTETMHQAQENK